MLVGNLFATAGWVVHTVLQLAWFVLMVRIVLSWLDPNPRQDLLRQLVRAIYQLTDPVLDRTRRALPFLVVGGLDLSPIALFIAIGALDRFLTGTLYSLAA